MKFLATTLKLVLIFMLIACVSEAKNKKHCKENQIFVKGSCVSIEPPVIIITPTPTPTPAPTLPPTPTPTPTIQPKLSCGSVPHNGTESRIAYSASSVAYGQSCSSIQQTQTRVCNDGVWSAWSGSYQYLTCRVQAALACGTIASGAFELRTMYQAAAVSEGSNCVSEIQNRQCTNGQFSSWSGTYTQPKCVVSRVRFESALVPNSAVCNPETQTMTCEGGICGVWSPNNYTYATCSLQPSDVTNADWSVWTEPMLANKPQPNYNPLNKPTNISLKGAKNEWVGFLICVRGNKTMNGFIPSVTQTLTSGVNKIANSNILFYMLFNHTTTERANAYEVPGTYPDAAVPYRDVYFNEIRNGVEAGWGQSVSANMTRVFFIEIYIPTTTLPGNYAGNVRLTSNNGTLIQDIPISLDVWNFNLPEQWSLKNIWGVQGAYWEMDATAFGGRDDLKAREYLFNLQKAAINHGFFLYGATARQVSGPMTDNSFTNPYFDGANDTYSWKRFLDGSVPQGYNPKPYPKTSVWITRDEQGTALIYKNTAAMDAWKTWIAAHNYNQHTLFFDKIIDEPDLSAINAKHAEHVIRHTGEPNRPMEFWTAGGNSYPKDSLFWNDNFKSIWMVSQFYTWYRSHDWGSPYGSPDDFNERIATYGDLLFSYTAGDNDQACDIGVYAPSRGIRAAVSESLDAYSRQNAYTFISDWHFKTAGHHNWMTNEGWQFLVVPTTADAAGNFSATIPQKIPNGTFTIYAYWTNSDGSTSRLDGSAIKVDSSSTITTLLLPASSSTVGANLSVKGIAPANKEVRVMIKGTAALDTANQAWSVTDPFGDYKLSNKYGIVSASANNGGGVYFYPGRITGTNYDIGGSHEIPIESYKLKLIRWGAQVYEYAKLLENKGKKDMANSQVDRMITFNVPNTITIHSVPVWENARETMGNEINSASSPTTTDK